MKYLRAFLYALRVKIIISLQGVPVEAIPPEIKKQWTDYLKKELRHATSAGKGTHIVLP